jgi:ABC-type transporter MlaC component
MIYTGHFQVSNVSILGLLYMKTEQQQAIGQGLEASLSQHLRDVGL